MATKPITRKVLPGQSIWDFACEHLGSPDGVDQLIKLNPGKVNFNDNMVVDQELIIGDVINQPIVDMFANETLKPSTSLDVDSAFTPIPPPPYIIFSRNSITGLNYKIGLGASSPSVQIKILADGLIPSSGNITVTPSTNVEVYDGLVWQSVPFTVPYTLGIASTPNIYQVRLKAGLAIGSYHESVTLSGANAADFVLDVTGVVAALSYIQASGGTEIVIGDYKIHVFNGDGIFNVLSNPDLRDVEYLIIAGGGGGGGIGNLNGGGGGAGGYLEGNLTLPASFYVADVGAGGAPNWQGSNSTFSSLVAIGGGSGGINSSIQIDLDGESGGSGGGAGGYVIPGYGALGVSGQGNKGGNSSGTSPYASGGGGGANANGANTGANSGDGGSGKSSSITGSAIVRAGGGGGGVYDSLCAKGAGGSGGGGSGGIGLTPGISGTINTGSGGGGGSYSGSGGANAGSGAAGVIIIKYKFQ